MPTGQPYSFGIYEVKQGRDKEFIDLWYKFANWSLSLYKDKVTGTPIRLIQDRENRSRYYSFAEWKDDKAFQEWRQKPEFNDYLNKFRQVCDHVERIICSVVGDIMPTQPQQQQRMSEEVKTRGR